jgi:hypothetical protein
VFLPKPFNELTNVHTLGHVDFLTPK